MIRLTGGREKVLKMFLAQPKEEVHLREIARRTNLSSSTVHKYLNEFVKNNLLNIVKTEKMNFFSANLNSEQLLKIFEMLEIDKLSELKKKNAIVWKIINELTDKVKVSENLLMLILFGSIARGEMRKESDIDVLVVSRDDSKRKIEFLIRKVSKEIYSYGKETVPIVITLNEFRAGLKEKKDFFKTLWEDRIIFYGESLFWREIARL